MAIVDRTEWLSIEQNRKYHDKLWHIMIYLAISWQIMTFCHKNEKKNIILLRKHANTAFLLRKFLISHFSISFDDLLTSLIAPRHKHWMTIPKFWPKPKPRLFSQNQNRDFFPRPNFSKPKPRLFFRNQIFPKPKPSKIWQKFRNREVSKPKCQSLPTSYATLMYHNAGLWKRGVPISRKCLVIPLFALMFY